MKKVDSYSFGKIVVNGKEYDNDIIIYMERVEPDWWREKGHSINISDIEEVLRRKPEILVVGRGKSSRMSVPKGFKERLEDEGIELKAESTDRAVEIFNKLLEEGRKVVGAFHLTC